MTARTVTIYVTGEFDGLTNEETADLIWESFYDNAKEPATEFYADTGEPTSRQILGITVPAEESLSDCIHEHCRYCEEVEAEERAEREKEYDR